MAAATVKQLFTYPIKGLTPSQSDRTFLTAGHGIKGDRALALMFLDAGMEEGAELTQEHIPWMSKKHFAVQNDWPLLAALECHYAPETGVLTVKQQGATRLQAETQTTAGRDRISSFFTEYLTTIDPTPEARHQQRSPVRLVGNSNGSTRYPDREPVHISLLSMATLEQLSEIAGTGVDVRRFRPNILLEGVSAWEEFSWVGQEFQLGAAKIAVTARIGRCVNIEVNPETGDRDLRLLSVLQEHFGHAQTGVLAKIINSGSVAIGDVLTA